MEAQIPLKLFRDLASVGEGMVFLGCAEPQKWKKGLEELWAQEGFIKKTWFQNPFTLETTGGRTGGRTDLVFPFSAEYNDSHAGMLAMWRLRFGDCSWISDYRVNYAKQHDHSERSLPPTSPQIERAIAQMAPICSREEKAMKVKKTVGKKPTRQPTRRSTRQKKNPARFGFPAIK